MHDSQDKSEEDHELDADAELLPDRELMSLIDTNVAIPVNGAVAANVLSDHSFAAAEAEQDAEIEQSNDEREGS
jgi:hypothetical protein